MFCRVSALRSKGLELNRFHATAATTLGQFSICEWFDEHARRSVRVARLLPCSGRDEDLLPPLVDAVVLYASRTTWTVRGNEREATPSGTASYEQTWLLREISAEQIKSIEAELASGREPRFVGGDF